MTHSISVAVADESRAISNHGRVSGKRRAGRSRAASGSTGTQQAGADDSPLAWLRRHGHLSDRQAMAADRVLDDYLKARLAPRITMSWDAMPSSKTPRGPYGAPDLTDSQLAARSRFEAAMAAVGPGLADVLWRVVCDGAGLEAAERALGWPRRAAKLVLGLALDRLADHYDPPKKPIWKNTLD